MMTRVIPQYENKVGSAAMVFEHRKWMELSQENES
jgi:hypothetical protein